MAKRGKSGGGGGGTGGTKQTPAAGAGPAKATTAVPAAPTATPAATPQAASTPASTPANAPVTPASAAAAASGSANTAVGGNGAKSAPATTSQPAGSGGAGRTAASFYSPQGGSAGGPPPAPRATDRGSSSSHVPPAPYVASAQYARPGSTATPTPHEARRMGGTGTPPPPPQQTPPQSGSTGSPSFATGVGSGPARPPAQPSAPPLTANPTHAAVPPAPQDKVAPAAPPPAVPAGSTPPVPAPIAARAPEPPPAPPVPAGDAPVMPAPTVPPQPPLLFEVAWEVCWQLGGIYTVLRTKAGCMLQDWGDRYCLIGPYNPATAPVEFEEQPTYGPIRDTIQKLREQGLICHFGRWLIPGRPRVILIDYRTRFHQLGHDKYLLWQDHGVPTPTDDGEVNEVVAFGFGVAEFFRVFTEIVKDRPVLAHFHEWMGGVAVPRIAHQKIPVATVFTTHATLLGRYLASDNPYFYDHLPFVNPDEQAAKYNIYSRFAIERAAAHASTVFTTVSDVTSIEAEKLLGRQPEAILPNGLNIHRFAAPHEFQALHARYKERINEFVMGHFFPSYTFDLDNTIYLFTAGRYEYRNKGMDMFIEALWRLNQRLKGTEKPPTIVAFIITRAQTRHINVDVLRNQTMFEDLRATSKELQEQMGQRLFLAAANGRLPTYAELLTDDAQVRLKRAMHAWRTWKQPAIVTHDLVDDAGDPVLRHARHRWLVNNADDPVKMVFHPEFVSATSPTISLDYEQFVRGCHMGVFPSYYEPWGYTPMECVALGIPSVTTDLSGFGAYVNSHADQFKGHGRRGEDQGILVLRRHNRSFDDAADELAEHLLRFVRLNRRQRIELRNRVERLGEHFDWSVLSRHYADAHKLALERVGAAKAGRLDVRMV